MGLVQAAIERAGIPTVSISNLPEVTKRVRPPRVLVTPFPLGYPLGQPNDPVLQTRIVREALSLLHATDLPVVRAFPHAEGPAIAGEVPNIS